MLAATVSPHCASAAIEDGPATIDVGAAKTRTDVVPVSAPVPVMFRSGSGDYSGRIAGSLGFVLVVALMGAVVVFFLKRKIGVVSKDNAVKVYGARLLSFKRIAPRLNVLVIEVGKGKVVTLADNGNSLLKLAEFDENTAQSLSENSDEK